MPTEIYRFRPAFSVLDKYHELDRQQIYCAGLDELNDPVEGLENVYWNGDRIVWRNLLQHYLYCLNSIYCTVKLCGPDAPIGPQHIPVYDPLPRGRKDFAAMVFAEICRDVFAHTSMDDFIKELVTQDRRILRGELLFYLELLHLEALSILEQVHARHGMGATTMPPLPKVSLFRNALKALKQTPHLSDADIVAALYNYSSQLSSTRYVLHQHFGFVGSTDGILDTNRKLLVYDFPRLYLRETERLLFGPWYTACFSQSFTSASMWSHYADKHQGVCLIFATNTANDTATIRLRSITSVSNHGEQWSFHPIELHPVEYVDKRLDVDFFRSLGNVSKGTLMSSWYMDDDGNVSQCLKDIKEMGEEAWRTTYWKGFRHHFTTKPKDWEHENEYRVVLYSLIADLSDSKKRKLTFEFKSLKGIIFGIHTSDTDKSQILDIVRTKCSENGVSDFDVFQAFYCPRTGVIDRARLPIRFSS